MLGTSIPTPHPTRITKKALKEQLDAALRALHYARDDLDAGNVELVRMWTHFALGDLRALEPLLERS
jgi:hypothetical protein